MLSPRRRHNSPNHTVLGLDGCKAGWVAVIDCDAGLTVELWPHLDNLFSRTWTFACVDIPIGLVPGDGRRDCDTKARDLLGKNRSSIFFAPPRQFLDATDYEQVRVHGMSLQTYFLLPKIQQMDRLIKPEHQIWLKEAHPELSFRTQSRDLEKKRTAKGRDQRQVILRELGSNFELEDWSSKFLRKHVALDDLLDAAILLEVAREHADGVGCRVGDDSLDPRGLSMTIGHLRAR